MEKKQHGGARKGAGRPSKIDELAFLEKLDNLINSDDAITKLGDLIKEDNFPALKLYMEYRFGKPKETVENINHNIEHDVTEAEAKEIMKAINGKY